MGEWIAQASQPTTSATSAVAGLLLFIFLVLCLTPASAFGMWWVGLFSPARFLGRCRPLVGTHVAVMMLPPMLLGVGAGFLAAMGVSFMLPISDPGLRGLVVTPVVFLVAFATILLSWHFVGGGHPAGGAPAPRHELGISLRRLAGGILPGLLTITIALPAVYAAAILTAILFQAARGGAQEVHPILKALRDGQSPVVAGCLIAAAVICAPLLEELLFRGMIQSTIIAGLKRMYGVRETVLAVPQSAGNVSAVPTIPAGPPVAPGHSPAWVRVIGIAITSVIFALIHMQPQFFPPLIVLSFALGLAYERTGNLWVVIVAHAAFNGLQITLLLSGVM